MILSPGLLAMLSTTRSRWRILMLPLAIALRELTKRGIESAAMLLPEPLSPTIPSVSPAATEKDTLLTA